MPHPGDNRRLGPLRHRNTFRSRYSATAHRGGVICNPLRQNMRLLLISGMKPQKSNHLIVKGIHIGQMLDLPSCQIRLAFSGVFRTCSPGRNLLL